MGKTNTWFLRVKTYFTTETETNKRLKTIAVNLSKRQALALISNKMKKRILLLGLLLEIFHLNVKSQTNFFKFIDQDKIKIFYDISGDLTIEKQADYHRIASIDAKNLYLDGEFSDYTKKDIKVFTGTFKLGKLNGICKYFFNTGQVKEIGKFTDGTRDSIWNFYYSNGQIEKVINFDNGRPNVLSLFSKKGSQLIKNGTGKYIAKFHKYNGKNQEYKIYGQLVDGKFDGKWIIPGITKETFKDGQFIEGFDVLPYTSPQQIQLDNLLGYYCQENVNLFQNNYFCSSCIKDLSWALYSVKGNINNNPYENFLSQFSKLLDSLNINNHTHYIEFETHSDGSIININTIGTTKLVNNIIVEKLLKDNLWIPLNCDGKTEGFIYMMIIKNENKIYLPQAKVITNNKEANFMIKQMTNKDLMICQ